MTTIPILGATALAPLVPNRDVLSVRWSLNTTVREMHALRTPYKEAIRTFQRRFIVNALTANSCHLGRTAQELRIHRNTLTRMIRELNIDLPRIRTVIRSIRRRGATSHD